MYTKEQIASICAENNSELLTEFTVIFSTYNIKCLSCGNIYSRDLNKCIHSSQWCSLCKHDKTIRLKLQNLASKYNGQVKLDDKLYSSIESSFNWICEKGHAFTKLYVKIQQRKKFCTKCLQAVIIEGTNRAGNKRVNLYSNCIKLAQSHKGSIISPAYIRCHSHYLWKCANSHTFSATYSNVQKGHWCPYCKNKTEDKVRKIFESLFSAKFPSVRPEWLISPFSNKRLELDGYNQELKLAFEYDGEYHYRPHYSNKDYNLTKRISCDIHKTEQCKLNGIRLIRIPYTEKNNLEEFIKQELNKEY